jgi:hypothetical protein
MSPANVTRADRRPPLAGSMNFESPPVNHGQAGTADPMWAVGQLFNPAELARPAAVRGNLPRQGQNERLNYGSLGANPSRSGS